MVVSGIGNDLYNPNQAITRAEFAAIMVRALGLKSNRGATPFSDVRSSDWYSLYGRGTVLPMCCRQELLQEEATHSLLRKHSSHEQKLR